MQRQHKPEDDRDFENKNQGSRNDRSDNSESRHGQGRQEDDRTNRQQRQGDTGGAQKGNPSERMTEEERARRRREGNMEEGDEMDRERDRSGRNPDRGTGEQR